MAFETFDLARSAQAAGIIDQIRARKAEAARAQQMTNLSRMALQGSQPAKMELGAQDPQRLGQLESALGKMDDNQRERVKHGFEMQGRAANYIQSHPEPLRAKAYQEAKQRIAQNDPELAARLPKEYRPEVLDKMFWFAQKGSEALTNAQRDIMAAETPRSSPEFTEKLREKTKDSDTSFEVKSSDERAMLSFIAPEYEGSIDLEEGIIDFKTPEDAREARKILTLATQKYRDAGGKLTRAEAVSEAFQEFKGTPVSAPEDNPFNQFDDS